MATAKLQVIPLGGMGEFGMNCMALRYGDDIVVIDAGMMFPDAELLGVDSVVPDFSYLVENKQHVRALLLTHGHEDHIGAVPFLLSEFDIPVYGTAFTLALVERRLEEHDMVDSVKLKKVKAGDKLEIGPFSIEYIQVTHSIVSSAALAITTPAGIVMHTGDFKIDATPVDNELFDLHAFAEYGKRGVLLLLSDSTNADRPGFTPSERAVHPRLEDIFQGTANRLIFTTFSSSIHRIQQILDLSVEFGRKCAFIGRSMIEVSEIAHNLGLLQIPNDTILRPQDVMSARRDKVCVIVSGTQGEPMSAMSRVAVDNHKSLSIDRGDTVVLSARIIPGNEKPIYRMMNHLARRGAELIYGSMTPPVHVSGHASCEELKLILNLVRPKYFMPIHGEFRQMTAHAKLAEPLKHSGLEEVFVMEDGQTLEIDSKGARRGPKVNTGHVCIDSGTIDEFVGNLVIRDRRHMSEDGFVLPVVAINKNTGLAAMPVELVSRGFIADDRLELIADAKQVVVKTLENSSAEERHDLGLMTEKIRADLKRFLSKQTQRRPLIMPVILEV